MATPIPANHASFTLDELVSFTGATLVGAPRAERFAGVFTDTRVRSAGEVFVALRGDSFDAHDKLADAHAAGAIVALVEREAPAPDGLALMVVPSTLEALGALARAWARAWRATDIRRRVIAITGSAGKTTTRVAVSALLDAMDPGAVHATKGNLNNLVGVPMTLFGLEAHHRFAVVEIGTNRPGEIAALTSIVEPEAGILTLIAAAHVEGFGSIDAIAHEKTALYRGLATNGLAVGNSDDARVDAALGHLPLGRTVTYGRAGTADYRIVERDATSLASSAVRVERRSSAHDPIEFVTPLLGEAGALACAGAIAVVEGLVGRALSSDFVTQALARAEVGGGAGRLVPITCADGLALIDDSYNANPASMCASIRASVEMATSLRRRLVLVLGEMRELGPATADGHDEVARAVAGSGAKLVIGVKGEAQRYVDTARSASIDAAFAEDAARAAELACEGVSAGDLVLVKGSRGIATERVVESLAAFHGGHATRLARMEGP